MSDDWQPGDLALCVNNGPRSLPSGWTGMRKELRIGAVYTVTWVGVDGAWGVLEPALGLAEAKSQAPCGGYGVFRFRKIRPHTPDAEDAETIRLLTGKPAKAPA